MSGSQAVEQGRAMIHRGCRCSRHWPTGTHFGSCQNRGPRDHHWSVTACAVRIYEQAGIVMEHPKLGFQIRMIATQLFSTIVKVMPGMNLHRGYRTQPENRVISCPGPSSGIVAGSRGILGGPWRRARVASTGTILRKCLADAGRRPLGRFGWLARGTDR